ncbi:hypothetical protein A2W24_04315 [Microgenomates group bacterium RBG_16_45_19]|nr:MAG: hypothetical protein A2W24_04315 [Microgenomates group bacterium RBG_16_45_19]
MKLTKLATAAATGAILLQAALPIFADTTLIISSNGSDTENEVEVSNRSTTTVVQENNTQVSNQINVKAETGDNEAEDNTGGDVSIETGDAKVDVQVKNEVNSNVAEVETCGECAGDTEVEISGNGSGSENEVELKDMSETEVYQTNVAEILNEVKVDAKTGDNEAEDNTNGDVKIDTGDATVKVLSDTKANMNMASIGGSGDGGSVKLLIANNGSDSDNEIELGLRRETLLAQDNLTAIGNLFDLEAETGDNEAEDNTGGEVEIETGNALVDATVKNWAGFNYADLGCCVLEDILAKIVGNGVDSENEIEAWLKDETEVFQGAESETGFENGLELEVETGDNEVEDSTQGDGEDPIIDTGDGEAKVMVSNEGSTNVLGDLSDWEMPEWDFGGWDFSFSFDFSDFLAWLGSQA